MITILETLITLAILMVCATIKLGPVAALGIVAAVYALMPYPYSRR